MRKKTKYANHLLVFILVFLFSCFIAVRDIGTDTPAYISIFKRILDSYHKVDTEILYFLLNYFVGFFTYDYKILFFVCGFLSLSLSWFLINILTNYLKLSDNNNSLSVIIFSMFLFSPFYFSTIVNVLRQGLATPILIAAFLMLVQKKYFFSIILFSIAVGFHKSSLMFIALIPLLFLDYRKLRLLILFLSVVYLSGMSYNLLQPIFNIIGLSSQFMEIVSYGASSDYRAGVRIDFFLFSFFFLVLAHINFLRGAINEDFFKVLMLLFVPFLFFGYIAYSDRLLLPLWYLIPIVLIMSFFRIYKRLIQKDVVAILSLFLGSLFFVYRLI